MAETRVVITAEVEQAIREINRLRGEASQSLSQLSKVGGQALSVVKALGVTMAVGAFVGFVKGSIDAIDALNDLSVRTKITISDLSGLAYAAKLGDTSLDGVASAVSKLAMNMGKDAQKFRELGITATEPLEAFKQLSDIFKDIQDPQQRAAFGAEVLGKSWQEAAVLLDGGSAALEEMINRGKELSGVSDQVAADAGKFNDKLDELGFVATGVGQRLAAELLPMLNLLVDDLTVTGDGVDKATSSFRPLSQVLALLVVAGGNVAYTFKALDQSLYFLAMQANQVTVAISKFLTLDFKGGLANIRAAFGEGGLGDIATQRAEKDRAAFDAWEERWFRLAFNAEAGAEAIKAAGDDVAGSLISTFLELERQENAAKKAAEFLGANESAAARKKAQAEQESAIKTATEYAASLRIEAAQIGLSADQVKMMAAAREAAKAPTAALRMEIMSGALARDIDTKAFAASEAAIKSVTAATQMLADSRASEYESLAGEVQAGKDAIAVYGKSKGAIEALTLARLEDRLARRGPQDLDLDEAEANHLMRMIALQKEKVTTTSALDLLGADSSVANAKELLDVLVAVDNAAKSAAQGMSASFGAVGTAIGGLTTALTGYAVQQQAIAAQLAAVKVDPKSSAQKIAQAEIAASKASAQAQIKSYGDMAGAAKGFFNENSKGYKLLETTEKAFRAYEMALAVESMVSKLFSVSAVTAATVAGEATKSAAIASGTSVQLAADTVKGTSAAAVAVATQAQGDPYTAWARMAAMAAAMAALGFAVFGGSGGGGATAKDRQASAGTGSILGDSSAKSNSIARSLELTAANSSIELSYTAAMAASLRSIESSISGLGNLLIRSTGITSESTVGGYSSTTKTLNSDGANAAAGFAYGTLVGGPVLGVVAGLASVALNKLLGSTGEKITNAIFGGKTTAQDTGLYISTTTLGNLVNGGANVNQYTDIKKDGGLFSSDKYSTTHTQLGAEINAQFSKVFAGLYDTVVAGANLLGVGGDAFTDRLYKLAVSIPEISTKGLTGEEIQKQLETVFSKVGDDIARFGVEGLAPFQKVGEGYLETLVRVASNYANLDSILASSGSTFGAIGLSSISAREHLIELTGGIDKLASQSQSFNSNFLSQAEQLAPVQKYVTDQLAAMGLQSLDTRDKFKDYVLGLASSGALVTEAGAAQYAALLALSEAFAKTHAATVDLTKSQQAIADETTDLQTRLDELTMTQTQLAAKARAAIAPVNQALYDTVTALTTLKDAQSMYASAVSDAESALSTAAGQYQSFVDAVTSAQTRLADAQKAIRDQYDKALAADVTAKAGVQAELEKITAGYIAATDRVKKIFDSITDDLNKFISDLDTTSLGGGNAADQFAELQTQFAIATAQARAGDGDAAGKLPEIAKNLLTAGEKTSTSALEYAKLVAYVRTAIGDVAAITAEKGSIAGGAEQTDLQKAIAEQEKWAKAVADSGASLTASSANLLDGYSKAVSAQQQSSLELKYWTQVAAGTGVSLADTKSALAGTGDGLIKGFYDAQMGLAKAQIELTAANAIKGNLELRQTSALENFVGAIKNVNTTAQTALDAAGALFAAASNTLVASTTGALAAQTAATNGMTYWGGVVTSTAAGIAASVQAMAAAAAAIAAAQSVNNNASAAASAAAFANEKMVRSWYANNSQYQAAGGKTTNAEVEYWLRQLATTDVTTVKERFAIAAARDSGNTTPLDINKFADGGAFTNGVVSRPTNFNIGQMGEAGSEAVMPLTNVGGRLGVSAVGAGGSSELTRVMRQVLVALERAGSKLDKLEKLEKLDSIERTNRKMQTNVTSATRDGQGFVQLAVGA